MDGFTRTQSSTLEQSTASLYNEAVKFHKAGLLGDAENKFRAALARNRRHMPSLLGLGSLLRECGRDREGTVLLQEASGLVAAPVDAGALAARASNQRIAKTSSLASFAFRRPPADEKLSSIQAAGNAVRQNLHNLRMVHHLSTSNGCMKASMLLSAMEAPGKGARARFEAKGVFSIAEQPVSVGFERASSAPAHVSSAAAASLRPGGERTISTDDHGSARTTRAPRALRGDQTAPPVSAPVVEI